MLIDSVENCKCDLITLWQQAFGDSEEYINLIFDYIPENCHCFVEFKNKRAVSALYALLSSIIFEGKEYHGLYIYACATLKQHRGKGIMSSLLNEAKMYAKKCNFDFLSLVPGELSLYDYYSRLGFVSSMYKYLPEEISKVALSSSDLKKISFLKYFKLKDEYLLHNNMNYFNFNLDIQNYAKCALEFSNYYCYEIFNGILIKNDKTNHILELIKKNTNSILPNYVSNVQPFGMLLPLNKQLEKAKIYMNIALD